MNRHRCLRIIPLLLFLLFFVSPPVLADVTITTTETATADLETRNAGATSRNAAVTPQATVDVTANPGAYVSALWASTDGWNVTVFPGAQIKGNGYGILFNQNADGSGLFRSGVVTNAGAISAASATGDAAGIRTGGASGTINNSGTITAISTEIASLAEGAFMTGNAITLINSGTITASGPLASGVTMAGFINTLVNSGTITATLPATGFNALGLQMMGFDTNSFTNSGIITASAPATSPGAIGFMMVSANANHITNSGNITANGAFDGIGAYIFTNKTNIFTNSGAITGNAAGDNAWGIGIQIRGTDNFSTNDGTITANAPGFNGNKATALYLAGTNNLLTNNGTITAAAAGDGTGTAEGVWMDGDNNRLTNTGVIRATSDCCSRGVFLENGPSAVTNSGTIEALAAGSGGGDAFGVWMDNTASTLVNTGIITATADLTAQGVHLENGINTITNSGTIGARAADAAAGAAYGVWMEETQNSLTNTGVITAAADFYTNGIYLAGSDGNTLANSGALTATSSAAGRAYGALMLSAAGVNTLTNSGTITAVSTPANPWSDGVYLEGVANHLTNSGSISGPTGVNAGLGNTTLINSGAITGTGGTAIRLPNAANALTLKTGSVINGAIDGSAGAADNLELNGTGSLAASQIVNFENLKKTGAGQWSVTAGSAPLNISSTMTVEAGTLAVGGSVTTPSYSQATGTGLGLIVTPATSATLTAGAAALNQGNVLVIPRVGFYARNTNYGVVFSAGGITGAFGGVSSTSPFLAPVLTAGANNYSLSLGRDYALAAVTPSQIAVANVLNSYADSLAGSTPGSELAALMLISGRTEAQVALDQLGGLSHTAFTGISFSSFNQYLNSLASRMGSLATGGPSTAYNGRILLASRNDTMTDAGNTLLTLSSLRDDNDSTSGGFWLKGYGNLGEMNGENRSSKYHYNTGGIAGGFDKKMSHNLLAGFSAGYSRTQVNLNDLSENATVSSYQGSVYGTYLAGPWYLNGILGYGYNLSATARNIAFGGIARRATADYAGHALAAFVEAGYVMTVKTASIIPLASFQAGTLLRDGFTENDAGAFNLTVDRDRTSSYLSALGIKASKTFALQTAVLTPEVRVRWLHEFSNDDYLINASFAGAPASTFSVRGEKPGRDTIDLGFGLTCLVRKDVHLFLAYDANLAANFFEQGGSFGIRYRW